MPTFRKTRRSRKEMVLELNLSKSERNFMRVNWRKFFGLFVLFNVVLLCSGCTATWIGVVQAMLPAVSAAVSAILAFAMSLEGKTVPASVTATIQKIVDDVQVELQNLSLLVASAQSGGATVLSQISAVLNSVLTNLGSILSGLSISDSATLQKITEIVGLAVAAVQAVLGIIPLAQKKMAESPSEAHLASFDKAVSSSIKNTHKAMQQAYHIVVTTPTDNTVVNEALAALPQQLP
jgi:hypothetical protein